jgi:hypothetical protein
LEKDIFTNSLLNQKEKLFITITREKCTSMGIECVNSTDGGDGGESLTKRAREAAAEKRARKQIKKKKRMTITEIRQNIAASRIKSKATHLRNKERQLRGLDAFGTINSHIEKLCEFLLGDRFVSFHN